VTFAPELVEAYASSPALRDTLDRRTLGVVIASQVLGGAGPAAGVIVGALLATQMLGSTGLAELPSALFTLGSAGAAFLVRRFSQRLGRRVGLTAGFITGGIGVTLLVAGITAAPAPADGMVQLMIALALLGLGWNFGLISGAALIVDATPVETRAKTQGSVDVLIALARATGGALSGVVVACSSYSVLSLAGGILAIVVIPAVIWSRRIPSHRTENA
jgi:MFS family permease